MKRVAIKHLNIRKCNPLFFWKFCSICGREFRRENGLSELDILGDKVSHCCEDCQDYFIKKVELKRKEWSKDYLNAVARIGYNPPTQSKRPGYKGV